MKEPLDHSLECHLNKKQKKLVAQLVVIIIIIKRIGWDKKKIKKKIKKGTFISLSLWKQGHGLKKKRKINKRVKNVKGWVNRGLHKKISALF